MSVEVSQQFEHRFIAFGVAVIKFVSQQPLPASIIDQLIRSATSIGANYAEAQNAVSRSDFRNKITIAKKEAAETRYWLRLIKSLGTDDAALETILQESHEIILILQKTIKTLQGKSP